MTEELHKLVCESIKLVIIQRWPVVDGSQQVLCLCNRCGAMFLTQRKPLEGIPL